ncbi:Uncharacterised protein [Vibrio cholerae]|nr:Uncharacterised protein [Vibrio cholerae]
MTLCPSGFAQFMPNKNCAAFSCLTNSIGCSVCLWYCQYSR